MSKRRNAAAGGESAKKATHKAPSGPVVENPDRKWRLSLAPRETAVVADNAPLLQMVVQNVGLATFEVAVEDRETTILMPGKLSVMLAYGRVALENSKTIRVWLKWSFCRVRSRKEAAVCQQRG